MKTKQQLQEEIQNLKNRISHLKSENKGLKKKSPSITMEFHNIPSKYSQKASVIISKFFEFFMV